MELSTLAIYYILTVKYIYFSCLLSLTILACQKQADIMSYDIVVRSKSPNVSVSGSANATLSHVRHACITHK